jgi:hypothetical protein
VELVLRSVAAMNIITWPQPIEPEPHPARLTWWARLSRQRERRAYAKSLEISFW